MIFKKPKKFVIDTSLFINPESRFLINKTVDEAIKEFLKLICKNIEIYMPKSVFKELSHFVKNKKILEDFQKKVIIKSPSIYNLKIPALIFREYIKEIRERTNKGLRIGEEIIRSNKEEDEKIRIWRNKFRDNMRFGIIDSTEDLDLILLTKELDAILITLDIGLIKWADKFGVKLMDAKAFISLLKQAE